VFEIGFALTEMSSVPAWPTTVAAGRFALVVVDW
jgi:hypothetical protein